MEQKLTYEEWIAQQFRDLEATIKGIPDALEAYNRSSSRTEFLNTYGKDAYSAYLNDFNFEVREGMKFFIKPYKGFINIPDAKFSWKALIPLGLDTQNKEIPHSDLPKLPEGDISILDAFDGAVERMKASNVVALFNSSGFKWQEFDEKGQFDFKYNPNYNYFGNIEILMEIERIRKEALKIQLEQGEITLKEYINELPVQDQRIIDYYLAQSDKGIEDLKIGTEYIVSNAENFYRIKIVDITETSIAFIDADMREEVVKRFRKEEFNRNFHIQEQLLSEAELFSKFMDAITISNYPDKTL